MSKKHERLLELIQISKMAIADGQIVKEEAEYLLQWLETNISQLDQWSFRTLYHRIAQMLQDGILDNSEQQELLETLLQISEAEDKRIQSRSDILSEVFHWFQQRTLLKNLALDHISVREINCCFIGMFAVGLRREIEELSIWLGSHIHKNVTAKTNLLIIGEKPRTRDLHHYEEQLKIFKEFAADGMEIHAMSEQTWVGKIKHILHHLPTPPETVSSIVVRIAG